MYRLLAIAAILGGLVCVTLFGPTLLLADDPPKVHYEPENPSAPTPQARDAELARQRIQLPQGLKVSTWATEPLLVNPVCFCFDGKGRMYLAETHRLHDGVTDIRGHMDWLDDDLACRTIADRLAMYRKYLKDRYDTYAGKSDRVMRIEDTKGTGKADKASVFADGFNHHEDGIGAGLVERNGTVWYTCIPSLWQLRDTKNTGKADLKKELQTGYGIHVGFLGHDLHGLRFGPDGKLYFSIGDRGLNVHTEGRDVVDLESGAVMRCNPDGSDLEIVATGLRNPQELTFDQYGNLFTGDNNADHGDKARWVYVVEGGDSGWRQGYQFMNNPMALGPWNAEKLWLPQWEGQAAYLVPPIANVADGPSGVTYYPGVGLPERYEGHFFLCDFRGSSGSSGVRSFAVKPKGASFEFVDQHQFAWSILATDCDFGPDGALYVSDWVEGWNMPKKGRIYRISDPQKEKSAAVQEVKKLLAEGMEPRSPDELARLLAHVDMRVRQSAQFALADRGAESIAVFQRVATENRSQVARLHAIWGLGQVGRTTPAAYTKLLELTGDSDAEVRAQAAKVLGDGRVAAAQDRLVALLGDSESRVRFFAALGLGRLGRAESIPPVLDMLRANADQDPYLRHAGVMALTGVHDLPALEKAAHDESPAVRLAVLLALRRLHSPTVAQFLQDQSLHVVAEAARAIYDAPIPEAMPQLAALLDRSAASERLLVRLLQARSSKEITEQAAVEPILYRALAANLRLGAPANAGAVAAFAARAEAPETLRVEALTDLGEWAKPSGRDRIVGLWRPTGARPENAAAEAIRPALGGIFRSPEQVQRAAAQLAARLGIKEVGPALLALIADSRQTPQVHVEALRALETLKDSHLDEATKRGLDDAAPRVRAEARRVLAQRKPALALPLLETVLEKGQTVEKQSAFAVLAELHRPEADALLGRWLDRLLAGQAPPEVQLDIVEAAGHRGTPELKAKLAQYEGRRAKDDHLAGYREALEGGDADAGRKVFFFKSETSCIRCHKINGEGGEVGPDLSKVGAQQRRDYLLESIVDPNKQIAKGFETAVLLLKSGKTVTGIVKEDTGSELRLMTAEGKLVTVKKSQIDERQAGLSAMPQDICKSLTKGEVRDLVEFLAGLK